MLLSEANVIFPLINAAPKAKPAPLLEAMNPLNPWNATLLFDTPMGGVKTREATGAYLL